METVLEKGLEEQKVDAAQELKSKIDSEIENLSKLMDDKELESEFKKWLSTMSRFNNYSLRNQLLICFQNPEASRVAGYREWQKHKRQVKKGEKSLKVLAPNTKRIYIDKSEVAAKKAEGERVYYTSKGKPYFNIVKGFRPASVFDVSQTEGKDLPELKMEAVDAQSVAQKILPAAKAYCEGEGIVLKLEALPENLCGLSRGNLIMLNEALPVSEMLSSLIHELGHEKLHWSNGEYLGKDHTKTARETEAESIAYIVCQYYGMDMSGSSMYIRSFRGDTEQIVESLERIQSTAKEIIQGIDKLL